jgi:hypothetical protein
VAVKVTQFSGLPTPGTHVDIAALSAAVVAVTVTLFLGPGIWGIINFVVSLTLFLVIVGYVWPSLRSFMQSAAVAAALALGCIPGIGFLDEARLSHNAIKYVSLAYQWQCGVAPSEDPCTPDHKPESRVKDSDLAAGWAGIFLLALLVDRIQHSRR